MKPDSLISPWGKNIDSDEEFERIQLQIENGVKKAKDLVEFQEKKTKKFQGSLRSTKKTVNESPLPVE